MGFYFHFSACQEARVSMSEEETQKRVKKGEIRRTETQLFAEQRI